MGGDALSVRQSEGVCVGVTGVSVCLCVRPFLLSSL